MKHPTLVLAAVLSLLPLSGHAQEATPTPPPPATSQLPATEEETPAGEPSTDLDHLYNTGKELFDTFASDEVKQDFEFPDKAQWDAFFQHLQGALDKPSLSDLASLEPEVRHALAGMQATPEFAEYASWLDERLDLIEAAKEVEKQPVPIPATPIPVKPSEPGIKPARLAVPYLDVWKTRLKDRPKPNAADRYLPRLKEVFAAEGVPGSLVWLAEVESSFNPEAKSPAGARGLYQLMPTTARSVGLSTFPFDERTHPEKSGQGAAKLLKELHQRFGSWPLALAAYNAGPTRVSNLLKASKPNATFADIASKLPSETRMYVPKVLATVSLREGVDLTLPSTKIGFAF